MAEQTNPHVRVQRGDEFISQSSSLSGTTTNTYDANGSLTSSLAGGVTTTYTYDSRNKMVGYADGTNTATYVYDDAGDRVAETANGTTTLYLTDTQNPTGYDQPIEQRSSASTAPNLTYVVGDRILGQAIPGGAVSYLLVDGHGSTQQITSGSGIVTAAFRYDAFGAGLNFNAATAGTTILFGGDAIYDPASGLYQHSNGRPSLGFLFTQMNPPGYSTNSDPLSLHNYLYAGANPIDASDPTGDFSLTEIGVVTAEEGAEVGEAGSMAAMGQAAMQPIEGAIDVMEGVESGYANAAMASPNVSFAGSFAVGFTGGFTSEALKFAGASCQVATGVGGAITDFGNDYLANGSAAFSWGGLGQALGAGLLSAVTATGCFVAGTPVLVPATDSGAMTQYGGSWVWLHRNALATSILVIAGPVGFYIIASGGKRRKAVAVKLVGQQSGADDADIASNSALDALLAKIRRMQQQKLVEWLSVPAIRGRYVIELLNLH